MKQFDNNVVQHIAYALLISEPGSRKASFTHSDIRSHIFSLPIVNY
jgi:hypothetical protein